MEYQAKLNEQYTIVFILFKIWKYFLFYFFISVSILFLSDFYFLLFTISFYINRYHFLQIFRISFNNIWKKIFVMILPFFNRFIPSPKLP